jgi:MOSC domain-containing protein YiiM
MGKLVAVCISENKGTRKNPVASGMLRPGVGLAGDAHAGSGPIREVSLLAIESIAKICTDTLSFSPGDFAENLTTQGINLPALLIGARLKVGEQAILEITQIGKKCHTKCAIFKEVGRCIMPREGVFASVIQGGEVKPEDEVTEL